MAAASDDTGAPGRGEGSPAPAEPSAAMRARAEGSPAPAEPSAAMRARAEGSPAPAEPSAAMRARAEGSPAPAEPSAAMRARAERNRQRARALRSARAAARPAPAALDTGGGFLPEESAEPCARPAPPPPAPLADPAERPACLECARPVAFSYLLDTFDHPVCDECRDPDPEGAHSLMTRTEAKSHYMVRDCDLDSRGGALRCVRRRNPHAARGDMRLYLRAQVEERALAAWGGAAGLAAARARREEARERASGARQERRLKALRMAVRSSLFRAPRDRHAHSFAPETYDAAADLYSRACACGHTETYEKM